MVTRHRWLAKTHAGLFFCIKSCMQDLKIHEGSQDRTGFEREKKKRERE